MPWLLRLLLVLACPGSAHGRALILENLALRQQLACFKARRPRPRLAPWDRRFWILLQRLWSGWKENCHLVTPETVLRWHRQGWRAFWSWKSRARPGRPATRPDRRELVDRLARENPTWGAPRIHGELARLGIRIGERTVSRLMPRRSPTPAQRQSWRTFLHNHREVLAAMDFLVVPTATFRLLYILVILDHGRRRVRHVQVTAHPTAEWVKAQLREAFPWDEIPKYLIFDRDRIFQGVRRFVEALGIQPKVISYRSPWQNGTLERFNGTLRRELLDRVIVWDEAHLHRLLKEYVQHYHEDRTHLALNKDSPHGRPVEPSPGPGARVVARRRLGGLSHRYTWTDAA